jgi:hypothetical protein
MMDVLPPKWTELFQHQEEQDITDGNDDHHHHHHHHNQQEQEQEHRTSTSSHRSCHHCLNAVHYNTYHHSCTIHSHHQHLPHSPLKYRTHSYSSNPSILEVKSSVNNDGETQLHGTRFRLTKATIGINDDEPQTIVVDDQYV